MRDSKSPLRIAALFLFTLSVFSSLICGQEENQKSAAKKTDDVVSVTTELIQTDVMVFDKKGRFVHNLKPEQFEINIDGKPYTIAFFEAVTAGSSIEAKQLKTRDKLTSDSLQNKSEEDNAATRERIIFFFVDDINMSGLSLSRARKALLKFVTSEMYEGDRVAIASSSGNIGFLQQLTDNRAVLREAVARLSYNRDKEAYAGRTQISEYMASQIADNNDRQLFAYLMESIKLEQQMGAGNRHGDHRGANSSNSAGPTLQNRIRQINSQSRRDTAMTLTALRGLIQSSTALTGRKLFFVLSDGFMVNGSKSDNMEQLKRITEEASRTGTVFYTINMRENVLGSVADASSNDYVDFGSRKAGLLIGERTALLEPLNILADDTGGRTISDYDSINQDIQDAIRETSNYYLLAWMLNPQESFNPDSKLKIVVKERPDLNVRLRKNFSPAVAHKTENVETNSTEKALSVKQTAASSQPQSDDDLLTALGSVYPISNLPVSLSVGYVHTQSKDLSLRLSMQIERGDLTADSDTTGKKALVDVIGTAIDDRGVIVKFKQVLTVDTGDGIQDLPQSVIWNQPLNVPPGLYQVRVAVRERSSRGKTGSAMQWIEVPAAAQGHFYMSSVFLGERKTEGASANQGIKTPSPVMVNVNHYFKKTSVLRFQTYICNAVSDTTAQDIWIQAKVLRRDNSQAVNLTAKKLPTDTTSDKSSLPYWDEIALGELPSGKYILQITATDRKNNTTVSQQTTFVIE